MGKDKNFFPVNALSPRDEEWATVFSNMKKSVRATQMHAFRAREALKKELLKEGIDDEAY